MKKPSLKYLRQHSQKLETIKKEQINISSIFYNRNRF